MAQKRYKLLLGKCLLVVLLTGLSVEMIHRIIVAVDKDTALGAALIDKHAYAATLPSPKILLLGGSGAMYCYNSQLLASQLNKPVTNMALLAPLGINFILAGADRYIRRGDTVILSFEYSSNTCGGDLETQLEVAEYLPESYPLISFPDISTLIKSVIRHRLRSVQKIPSLFESPAVEDRTSIYFRRAFNRQGDIISHINNFSRKIQADSAVIETFNFEAQIDCMNVYIDLFKKRGANVFFAHPVVAQTYHSNAQKAIEEADQLLLQKLHAPILIRPQQSYYPDSLFFDSIFHLKPAGRDIQTQKLIHALQPRKES